MALVLEIVLGVMILASFFVAYMSARTWPILQVVFAVLVFLAAVTFFYLGARTLATHRNWRSLANRMQNELEAEQKKTQEIIEGGALDAEGQPGKGIKQLKRELSKLAADRGGVFYDVAVDKIENGKAQLTLKSPNHGLLQNAVVFVFDQNPIEQGGRFVGEGKVVTVTPDSPVIEIAANLPLTDAQEARLDNSKGPWTLYTTMPVDDPAVFAKLDEKARGPLLPKESQAEFADMARTLRDYEYFFHQSYVQRSLLTDAIFKIKSDLDRTEAAVKETVKEIGYRTTEKSNLAADLERFQIEVKAIASYQQSLEKLQQQVRDSLKATFNKNRELAAELTTEQLRAAEEINQRTSTAAVQANAAPAASAAQ